MSNHTKGPWEVSGQLIVGAPESFPNPQAQPMGKTVGEVYWDFGGDRGGTEHRIQWQPEGEANAHLIAAAPELLACLREQTRLIEQFLSGELLGFPSAIRGQVKDVIAKAEGRTR